MLIAKGGSSLKDQGLDTSLHGLWGLGFGRVQTVAIIDSGAHPSLTRSVLLANLPQFLLSVLYFSYNSIYTCQMVAYEWNGYSQRRSPLRVTSPSNGQRSTYFLGLPYSYGIPLLVISTLLHWMFSRAFFLVNIKFLDYRGRPRLDAAVVSENRFVDEDINQCGYSPIAVILSIIVSSVILIAGLLNGLRRYGPGLRVARTYSTAISAACHPSPEEIPDLVYEPLQWGIICYHDAVEHCSFSSRPVGRPPLQELDLRRPRSMSHRLGSRDWDCIDSDPIDQQHLFKKTRGAPER